MTPPISVCILAAAVSIHPAHEVRYYNPFTHRIVHARLRCDHPWQTGYVKVREWDVETGKMKEKVW